MSPEQLRDRIEAAGLLDSDCYNIADLQQRAREAGAKLEIDEKTPPTTPRTGDGPGWAGAALDWGAGMTLKELQWRDALDGKPAAVSRPTPARVQPAMAPAALSPSKGASRALALLPEAIPAPLPAPIGLSPVKHRSLAKAEVLGGPAPNAVNPTPQFLTAMNPPICTTSSGP